MNHTHTLFGGKKITVAFEPAPDGTLPTPAEIQVRQIPVREYEAGFLFVDDEPALVGFLCAQKKDWALTLAPESFEEILVTGREVNAKGFFSFCRRRMARNREREADMIGLMATLPADQMKTLTDRGLELQRLSRSPILSPGFVSPPAR
jgi:hypothetical protein